MAFSQPYSTPQVGSLPLVGKDAESTLESGGGFRPRGVQSRNLSRDEVEVRMPRSRPCEFLLAAAMGFFTLTITVYTLIAIIVPLVWHEFTFVFNALLGGLSILALASSSFIMQVGWGAYRWTGEYKRTKDIDWYKRWQVAKQNRGPEVKDWSCVRHFVIFVAYKEPIDMLRLAAYALMAQRSDGQSDFCRDHIVLVFAMEEREGSDARIKADTLKFELQSFFCDVLSTYHPADLPGDIKGKASNYKWAVGEVEEYIRHGAGRQAGFIEQDCIIHVADADSLFDPNMFPNVQYHYCVDPQRDECVWQPCMIPTCNFWEIAPVVRQLNLLIACQEMMSAYDPWEFQITFSTYGISLTTLQAIGSGNAADAQDGDVITEDHHLFIKGFYVLGGALRVHPIFLPCLNFSVGDDPNSCCKNICDRFTQARRHMFGVSELIYASALFSRNGCRWCCRRRNSRFARLRAFCMIWKFGKVHFLPYGGLWVILGVVLITVLKIDKIVCVHLVQHSQWKHPWACDFAVTRLTETVGVTVFTVASFLSIFGGLFSVISFARMLRHTHHTLTHIADPTGPLMPSLVWQGPGSPRVPPLLSRAGSTSAASARATDASQELIGPEGKHLRICRASPENEAVLVRRPVVVGAGFPWCGMMCQLCAEFLVFASVVTIGYGTIPAVFALLQLIRGGHRMEYITAAKPGTGTESNLPTSTPRTANEEGTDEKVIR